ncbi:hypothetical protein POL68_23560 [Stigmatella sp. ncwal1]|uniref:Uncharacterized protein n=1 Tax=Stigmatella ashevillensis TaxID=2995309 RepID=A0ABT5DCX3_9BACT|nr:hypothetical protein [Stigmatella ashevillena]MDC0711469.1 hypothetical protein [Stigmatella ashevillena]
MSTAGRAKPLRLALFAEGTTDPSLDKLWGEEIPKFLGLAPFDRVIGFSKHHMVAMSKANMSLKFKTSTLSVGLDVILAQELQKKDFDCAVVAWDLVPAWDSGSDATACRWQDTLLLYEGLARSQKLPPLWHQRATERFHELKARPKPSDRKALPRPEPGMVLSVCMEPEFEGLLLDEAGVKAALGLKGKKLPRRWPTTWKHTPAPRPSETLARAIEAARSLQPQPPVFRKVRQPLREAKHEWGRLLLSSATPEFRRNILAHPLAERLRLLLSAVPPP